MEYSDFGYTGQKYFRGGKHFVYRCKSSKYVCFPFGMEKMVVRGIITPEQLIKFMSMLESRDDEMEKLAIQILTELCDKHKIEPLL